MNKAKLLALLVVPAMFTVGCSEDQDVAPSATLGASTTTLATGNDAPSGAHYNLNIIGVPKNKTADMTGNNGHRIFVDLGSKTGIAARTKINLLPGTAFQVMDANGTDGEAAFEMPADVATTYKVYARALGGPNGGSTKMTTCADGDVDEVTEDGYVEVCSSISLTATSGSKPKFEEVSDELLTVSVLADVYGTDTNGDQVLLVAAGTYNVFDPAMEDYFWQYDNNGLKLLQLRFYPQN